MPERLDENRAIVMEYLRKNTVVSNTDFVLFPSDKPFEKMGWVFAGCVQFVEYPFYGIIVQLFKLGQRLF